MLIARFDNNNNIEQHISEFEKKYNFVFPEQYRDFLLKYNGGETLKTKFKINGINSSVRAFYRLGNADEYCHFNLLERTESLDGFLKDNIIPIASNLLGDDIIMNIENGEIFFIITICQKSI